MSFIKLFNGLMYLCMFLVCIIGTRAFYCDYDNQPYIDDMPFIEEKIIWSCYTEDNMNNYSCLTYVKQHNDGDIIQLNPTSIQTQTLGLTDDAFESKDGIMNIYFTDKNLVTNYNYSFNVGCSVSNGSHFEYTLNDVSPVFKNLDFVPTRMLWLKENIGYFFVFVLLAMMIILGIWIIKLLGGK